MRLRTALSEIEIWHNYTLAEQDYEVCFGEYRNGFPNYLRVTEDLRAVDSTFENEVRFNDDEDDE